MSDFPKDAGTPGMRARIDNAADEVTRTVHEEAERAAGRVTSQAGDRVENAAAAAAAAGSEFETGSMQAQAADHMAASLQQVAGAIRDTDLKQAAGQVSRFARENPLLFIGGTTLLGFAAARFLKATDQQPASARQETDADPWTGHVTSSAEAGTADAAPDRRASA
ncbi:hypothetical protein [uncultured Roseobacter sp.]|uniref:hypothetical protein n=1 Tax=uncultured Roseobacter sp. TaxID=114847 RepID=UPI002631ED56|nr:hypothetical protein [uncultured Roseobacter sp.]